MASPMQEGVGRYRPLEGKSSKSPKSKNISSRHRGRTPSDTFRKSEQSLRELLEDFESGRLNAFENSDMLQKMKDIREMQEKLTLKHFEIDQMKINEDSGGPPVGSSHSACEEKDDASLKELTQGLEKLGTAIQSLHSDYSLIHVQDERKPSRRVYLKSESIPESQTFV